MLCLLNKMIELKIERYIIKKHVSSRALFGFIGDYLLTFSFWQEAQLISIDTSHSYPIFVSIIDEFSKLKEEIPEELLNAHIEKVKNETAQEQQKLKQEQEEKKTDGMIIV